MKKIALTKKYIYDFYIRLKALPIKCFRKNWPAFPNHVQSQKVALIIVNYNTKQLISYLLFSVFGLVDKKQVAKILVIDNNSRDGSAEFLEELKRENMISLIQNKKQKYHGPALNQGLKFLQRFYCSQKEKPFRYILILDSDVILLKDTIIRDAIDFLEKEKAAVVGQFQYQTSGFGEPHISSVLMDPSKVWKRSIFPFIDHGSPTILFYRSLRKKGIKIGDFPFNKDNYLLHLGRGTIREIFINNEGSNWQYEWSKDHHTYHYHGNPNGEEIFSGFVKLFEEKVGELTPKNLAKVLKNNLDCKKEMDFILSSISHQKPKQ